MVKPEECSYCRSEALIFVPNNTVFNPDLDIDEKMDTYVCIECKTIHVNNNDICFYQVDINTNKLLQTTETNISIN